MAISVPSLYLSGADFVAIHSGVWVVNPKSVVGIYFFDDLPLEEVLFFFIVNTIIVFAYCAFDKGFAVIQTFPEEFPAEESTFWKLCRGFLKFESNLCQETIKDIAQAQVVLRRASRSFWAASFIFPSSIRQDLSILYAFCRVTDDMVDDPELSTKEKRQSCQLYGSSWTNYSQTGPRMGGSMAFENHLPIQAKALRLSNGSTLNVR